MPHVIQGESIATKGRFAIVVSRYNESITGKLLSGALETLAAHNIADDSIEVAWVPGAWEIPVAAQRFTNADSYVAVICLGAVIRGETTHDQYINQQVSSSLGQLALESDKPVLFGLLTCNSMEQAIHRSGGNLGNKGADCAAAALEMVNLLNQLPPLAYN